MKTLIQTIVSVSILFCLTSPLNAASTGDVIGQVLEKETNRPVPYAEIVFENKMDKIIVTANEYGYYYANRIPTGKYQMRVLFNDKTFLINNIRVYDSYTSEVNFYVSVNSNLPEVVEVEKSGPMMSSVNSSDIRLAGNTINQPTQSLSEALSTQPGIDIRDGRLFVKGSDQVRFFIDGTPVLGQPVIQRIW